MRQNLLNKRAGFILAFFTTIAALAAFAFSRAVYLSNRVDSVSLRCTKDLLSASPGYISEHLPEDDLRKIGLSRKQYTRVLEEVTFPYLRNFHLDSIKQSGIDTSNMFGITLATVSSDKVKRIDINVTAERTSSGSIVSIGQFILIGWQLGLAEETGEEVALTDALIWGISRDAAKLKALGLRYIPQGDSDAPPVDIEVRAQYIKFLKDFTKKSMEIDASGESPEVKRRRRIESQEYQNYSAFRSAHPEITD
ncbi:MAG: hypothetical protein ACKVQS_14445 [Fimbriimonadaceae bacterium]